MCPMGLWIHVKMYKNGSGDTSVWYRHLVWLHITFCALQALLFFFFYKFGICANPTFNMSVGATFSAAFAHLMSLSHLCNSSNISEFFIIIMFVMVICEWWSSMLVLQKIMTPWRLRWWLSFFIKKELFLGDCTMCIWKFISIMLSSSECMSLVFPSYFCIRSKQIHWLLW